MILRRYLLPAALAVSLSSCQTATPSTVDWVQIAPGPILEQALAYCQIQSSQTQQGMIAMGSTSYVLGAQIGNAIANDMRRNEFIMQCMVLLGWKGVPRPRQSTPARP